MSYSDRETHFSEQAIVLCLRFEVKPGNRGPLLDFLAEAIPYYERPSGVHIRLLQDEEYPDRFIELVEYADRATYERDQMRVEHDPVMGQLLSRWRSLLQPSIQIETYRDVVLGLEGRNVT